MSKKVKVVIVDDDDFPNYILIPAKRYYEMHDKLLPRDYEIELNEEEWKDYQKIDFEYEEWQRKIGDIVRKIKETQNGD